MKKKIQVVVDRIEDNIAIIELPDMNSIDIDIKYLPSKTVEGSVIDVTFELNDIDKNKIIDEVKQLQNELLNQ